VDGLIGAYRGHLGQGLGHSLIGLFALCVPGGVLLWFALHALARHAPTPQGAGFLSRAWNMGMAAIRAAQTLDAFRRHWRYVLVSLFLGAFSHMFFDLISHAGFHWLYPWLPDVRIFPAWWYTAWTRLPVPGYRNPYPVGPHLMVWVGLSLIGAYLLFRPVIRVNSDKLSRQDK